MSHQDQIERFPDHQEPDADVRRLFEAFAIAGRERGYLAVMGWKDDLIETRVLRLERYAYDEQPAVFEVAVRRVDR